MTITEIKSAIISNPISLIGDKLFYNITYNSFSVPRLQGDFALFKELPPEIKNILKLNTETGYVEGEYIDNVEKFSMEIILT